MILAKPSRILALAAAMSVAIPSPGDAQETIVEFSYGAWWNDSNSATYSFAFQKRLLGPFDYGLGVFHLSPDGGPEQSLSSGGEFSLGWSRYRPGPYLVAAVGLGMRHSSGDFDAHWSAGAGYSVLPLKFLSLSLEARYRVEDGASRGFWRLQPEDARGVALQAGVSLRFGRSGGRTDGTVAVRPQETWAADDTPSTTAPAHYGDSPREVVELRDAVVATALDVMGTPYRWGGDGESGFDCSGLIQYAYREHGLLLPRTSRDQARMGLRVGRSVPDLRPGDILGFSEGGGRITHVGLYVGDGMFIHSASSGVKLSSLVSAEGDGRWWQQRWVSARRVIN